jgi:hypothetical protein
MVEVVITAGLTVPDMASTRVSITATVHPAGHAILRCIAPTDIDLKQMIS